MVMLTRQNGGGQRLTQKLGSQTQLITPPWKERLSSERGQNLKFLVGLSCQMVSIIKTHLSLLVSKPDRSDFEHEEIIRLSKALLEAEKAATANMDVLHQYVLGGAPWDSH